MKIAKLAIALSVLIWAQHAAAEEMQVIDGDTIKIENVTYRLHGIDAPEYGQKCAKFSGGKWACGKDSTAFLKSMTEGKTVNCDAMDVDDYGRVIAVCKVNGFDINAEMVLTGMAWAYTKYSNDYVIEQDAAKQSKVGVWQANTQSPWEYRRTRWEVAEQEAPKGCPIKGNISRAGERIYHAPWSPWYNKTKVSVEKGERWFCTEKDATDAGWRAPIWGG